MPFANTRRKLVRLAAKTLGADLTLTWDLPKTGLLAGIYIKIRGTIGGTVGTVIATGMAGNVRQCKLFLNSGIDVFRMSGAGYHYILRDFLEHYEDGQPSSTSRDAVTAADFILDMYIPVALNSRDPVGLIMLQNEQTLATLAVEFEALTTVTSSGTRTAVVVEPTLELFTVPLRPEDHPPLNMIHQILEEKQAIAATSGDIDYPWPRGNTYAQVLHGYGINQSPLDSWDYAKLIVNQSETLIDFTPINASMEYDRFHGRARLLGTIPFDLFGSSGLGCFGSARDFFDSALVTDVLSRITINAAADLYTVRRQLVDLGEG